MICRTSCRTSAAAVLPLIRFPPLPWSFLPINLRNISPEAGCQLSSQSITNDSIICTAFIFSRRNTSKTSKTGKSIGGMLTQEVQQIPPGLKEGLRVTYTGSKVLHLPPEKLCCSHTVCRDKNTKTRQVASQCSQLPVDWWLSLISLACLKTTQLTKCRCVPGQLWL